MLLNNAYEYDRGKIQREFQWKSFRGEWVRLPILKQKRKRKRIPQSPCAFLDKKSNRSSWQKQKVRQLFVVLSISFIILSQCNINRSKHTG